MTLPLMPKATAAWLVENTALSFEQISEFCGMHMLEVQGIADGEVGSGIMGKDPIIAKQVTREELERCEADPSARLKLISSTAAYIKEKKNQKKKNRYTPIGRRQDKPNAIAWLLKHCPEIKDAQVVRLIGTTKKTIEAIRDKSHWNWSNITPKDPVLLELCSQTDLDKVMAMYQKEAASEDEK